MEAFLLFANLGTFYSIICGTILMDFYTYLWLREDGIPYYVGKGQGTRAFDRRLRGPQPPLDRNKIIIEFHQTESAAFEAEIALIFFYGRKDLGQGCLRNLTNGGEGAAGGRTNLGRRWKKSESARLNSLGNKNGVGNKIGWERFSHPNRARRWQRLNRAVSSLKNIVEI